MTATQERHVLIIGAGITGLIIAHGLRQVGIKCTIFEAEEAGQWRPKDWTMGIHWSLSLLEALLPQQLATRITKDGSVDGSLNYEEPPNNGAYIFDGMTGQILKDLTVTGRIVRASRRKLRALCLEGVDVLNSHTFNTLVTNEDSNTVTATFTNGHTYTGTLLVGADGPRSAVRSCLFESNPAEAQAKILQGGVSTSMVITYPDPETARFVRSKSHPVWCMSIHPNLFNFMSMQDVVDPHAPETWRFFLHENWLGDKIEGATSADIMKDLKTRGAKLAEPFRTAITAIPDDTHIAYQDMLYWIAQPWDTRNGLVTLAGDAAHPMPPFRGQGGNHAIQDAHNFVEAVKEINKETDSDALAAVQANVIKEYSDEVAKRGMEETQLSTRNGMMMMQYHDFKNSPYMKQGLNKG